MTHDDEMQTDDQVSRDAQGLLDEYFRIRREYNSLDRNNPAHAPRRAVLKEQYFALDRKYTDLIRLRAPGSKSAATDAPRSRADVLWEGAFSTEEKLEDVDMNPVDAQWIELNTPTEGRAADEVFEEALRSLEAKQTEPRAPQPVLREEPPRALEPLEMDSLDEVVEEKIPALDPVASLGDLDTPNMSAVSALRDIAKGLQSEEPMTPLSESGDEVRTPPETSALMRFARDESTGTRRPPQARNDARARKRAPKADERKIGCPSCGEMVPAGTVECGFCHARLFDGVSTDPETARHIPHTQLQTPETREKPGIGPKVVITIGWLIVLAGSTWLILRGGGVESQRINDWLSSVGLSFLGHNQASTILGVSLVLLGTTIVGAGVFVGRFVRLIVPMHELARAGRVDTIEKLILQGEDIDARDERGCTPLHFAIVARQREVVAVLIGNGADINAHNDRGDTPLHLAAANRDVPLVQYLLGKGADAESLNDSGSSLLHVAAWVGDIPLLKICFEHGLRIDERTRAGFTPLHFAAQSGYDDAVAFLLEKGADPNAASHLGTTPLFAAVRNGHLPVVRRLVQTGADVNLRRQHDLQTPLGLANAHQRAEIAEFLRSNGAKSA